MAVTEINVLYIATDCANRRSTSGSYSIHFFWLIEIRLQQRSAGRQASGEFAGGVGGRAGVSADLIDIDMKQSIETQAAEHTRARTYTVYR